MSLEVVDGVSVVRFDHPPVNALDLDVLDDVVVTMRGLDGPVVITGAGRFSRPGLISARSSTAVPNTPIAS